MTSRKLTSGRFSSRVSADGFTHNKQSFVHPMVYEPGRSETGIQFVGPQPAGELYDWPAGTFRCAIVGWVDRNVDQKPNLRSTFTFELNEKDIAEVRSHVAWRAEDWKRFHDPDHAWGLQILKMHLD